MLKCEKCGKELKNDLALKIHVGRMHAEGKKAAVAPKKRGRPAKAAKGAIVCSICGRSFNLAAHLARHASAAHGKARKVRGTRRAAGRKVVLRAAPVGPEVRSLTVDQLIALKHEVDGRLAEIVKMMRAARVQV
jgi:hypothetical protein